MGKNDFLTPKAVTNRMKSKRRQKLRWYCQMCKKQCRDENGFKCHCTSESYQRQMKIFGQNPARVVAAYSEEFERLFLDHMKRNHRVAATVVYNEYIADRHHVHMNATQWTTLNDFVEYLRKTEKCRVEYTTKGTFITYIDRDSKREKKRNRSNLAYEEKQEREIKKQREKLMDPGDDRNVEIPSKKLEAENSKKIKLTLRSTSRRSESSKSVFDEMDNEKREGQAQCTKIRDACPVLDEIMREEEEARERKNRKDYWLCAGIIVKVKSKAKKGIVHKVVDKYVAEIEMIEMNHVVTVDQEDVETVIPQIGGLVRIVNGAYRGSNTRLLAIDTNNYCATVQIERGIYEGKVLKAIDYGDISKCY